MLKWINREWAERGKLRFFWRWWKRGGSLKNRVKRLNTLKHFAARRAKAAHHLKVEAAQDKNWKLYRKHAKTEKRWLGVRVVYRRQHKRAKKRLKRRRKHNANAAPQFQAWQLSGNSGNVDDDLKPVIAYLVVECGQWITDTYDYAGHTSTSLHYPRNDPTPPQQGRAVDAAGPNMADAMTKVAAKFDNNFLELFGPVPWYLKNGARIAIHPYFPGHGDHIHAGRA